MAAVVALIAGTWWLALGGEEPAAEPAAGGPPGTDVPERPARARDDAPAEPARETGRPERPGFEARRAEWQERWRQAVTIAPTGARAPGFTPDAIREALSPSREQLRACVTESGGWRGLFEARRAQWAERRAAADGVPRERPRSRVSFQVRADGTVDPATVAFDPPMPDAYRPCFEAHFTSLRLDDVGDGARVDLPMGPPGGRPMQLGDGGVPTAG